jgi:hypothetical protein
MFEDFKGITVVSVEAIVGAEPHKTATVLHNAGNGALRKPILYGQMFEIDAAIFSQDSGQGEQAEHQEKENFKDKIGIGFGHFTPKSEIFHLTFWSYIIIL